MQMQSSFHKSILMKLKTELLKLPQDISDFLSTLDKRILESVEEMDPTQGMENIASSLCKDGTVTSGQVVEKCVANIKAFVSTVK